RGIRDTSQQRVWAFLGDGEMDEPESRGFLHLAAAAGLDNLTFVINCNLQRLDGPVRGNGKIIQELEAGFRGAGWNVIKTIWGREWDSLLAADKDHALVNLMNRTPDGDYQTYRAESGAYIRENFFARDPRTLKLVEKMSDDDIWAMKRGGHDYRKVFASYHAATHHTGQPTVILAKTIKGYGLGPTFAGRMSTHQMKTIRADDLRALRDSLRIPISDAELDRDPYLPPYYNPGPEAEEIKYMLDRRTKLGGYTPQRRTKTKTLPAPKEKAFEVLKRGSGKQEVATTQAFVRLFKDLIKDPEIGKRFVPIIPDEARTFGLDAIFPTAKIYNPHGQTYTPVDANMMLSYRESAQGQVLHTGINEAGSVAAFTAAGTAYSTQDEPMIPVYIFYSMFGFQRTGDGFWAAADQMTRGFVIGATAGRTTLTGEGLQHADGHSPLLAYTNPAVVHYDPAYGYEISHIIKDGIKRMYGEDDGRDKNVMYYLTVYNEPMYQPEEPENVDVDGILRGMHRVHKAEGEGPRAQLLASGVAVPWALEAAELLEHHWGVQADVWSVTAWGELRKEGLAYEDKLFLEPGSEPEAPYVTARLKESSGPVVAVTDYNHSVPDMIRQWVPEEYATLGADSYGFSDTRPAARRHFKIDGPSAAVKVLQLLAKRGEVDADAPAKAIERYDLHNVHAGTTGSAGGDS
ncbi:MAG TPA: pyruvate dehydrogenase (acetyl-transferring), homodimeric type, partial [Actinomycetales bacterium]|nr:pyruvate dehydrogenase (acetyl-transferring), homodimeric type [Actinomycetales bacterium]